jgi:hypothetical protein
LPSRSAKLEHTFASGVSFKLLEDGLRNPVILQGACFYSIDPDKIREALSHIPKDQLDFLSIYNKKFLVRFPIGSVNVTASRETLELDKPTCKMLVETAKEISNFLINTVKDEFLAIDDLWEAAKYSNALYNNNFPIWELSKTIVNTIVNTSMYDARYKNFEIDLTEMVKHQDALTKQMIDLRVNLGRFRYVSSDNLNRTVNVNLKERNTAQDDFFVFNLSATINNYSASVHKSHFVQGEPIFIINTGNSPRFREKIAFNFKKKPSDTQDNLGIIYLIDPKEGKLDEIEKRIKQFSKNAKIFHLCDLPEPPKEAKETIDREKYLLTTINSQTVSSNQKVDLDKGGVYFITAHNKPDVFDDKWEINRVLTDLISLKVLDASTIFSGIYDRTSQEHQRRDGRPGIAGTR